MFPFLAFTTLTVALLAGFVVTIVDKEDFPNYGTAVWWAVVTLGTVGYGDVVPTRGGVASWAASSSSWVSPSSPS